MNFNYPEKTVKKIIKRILNRKRIKRKTITEDELDHLGTELYDELGPLPTEEEDATYGLKGKGYHKVEPEDGL